MVQRTMERQGLSCHAEVGVACCCFLFRDLGVLRKLVKSDAMHHSTITIATQSRASSTERFTALSAFDSHVLYIMFTLKDRQKWKARRTRNSGENRAENRRKNQPIKSATTNHGAGLIP